MIVAWNLINEPRCDAIGCNKNIQAWVGEMAPYLKSLDPNHLITIGTSQFPSSSCVCLPCAPSHMLSSGGQCRHLRCLPSTQALAIGLQAWMASMTDVAVRQQPEIPVAGLATPDRIFFRSMLWRPLILQPSICGQTTGSVQIRPLAASGSPPTLPMELNCRNLLYWRSSARWAPSISQAWLSCIPSVCVPLLLYQNPLCAPQGVGGELAKGETAAQRLGWYKEVYSIVEQQLQNKR